ncbi:hypothetical protein H0H81_012325 [Sphagnurus paluster]|uniref:Glycosyltransferase family 1 protein n=1 Tax=Sphagnurus paluster TaxID=117069 RepID=A0A9P7FU21_9AGAR|nr:hypothetical protein H0H81_012325 [Sphagnurus paluster]
MDMKTVVALFDQSYGTVYEKLSQGKPVVCSTTGKNFDAAPAPTAVILDFFWIAQLKATRALTGRTVPVISWVTGGSSMFLRLWGPEALGGLDDFGAKVHAEVALSGRHPIKVGDELYRKAQGTIVRIPGLPPMYDYEFQPQQIPFTIPVSLLLITGREFLLDSDGILIASCDAYEKGPLDGVRQWFADWKKPIYTVGPLLPAGYTSTQSDANESHSEIEHFLFKKQETHGKRSVVFISFGTAFWPTTPEYLEEVVDALLEKEMPFILSCASPFANVPAELSEKIKNSSLGLLAKWTPQQFVLNHPATGWFLTHGGHGGITESLASGIPLICWPFDGDQPTAAVHVTENLKVAFELIEVRTGQGLRPICRNGKTPKGTREAVGEEIRRVLDSCKGEEGEQLRRNAERLRGELADAWKEGGTASVAISQFLEKYT